MTHSAHDNVAERTLALARSIAAQNAVKATIEPDDALVGAGIDSMALVNLMLAVEAEFDIVIRPELLNPRNFKTVATIAGMVEMIRAEARPRSAA